MLNLKDPPFNAAGDLSQNDSPALQLAIDTAAGDQIYVPPGRYRLDNPVSTTLPVNLVGVGNGCGPGPAAISNSNCSQFFINFNGTAIKVTNLIPSTFRGLQFNVNHAYRYPQILEPATTAIWLTAPLGPTETTANSIIEGCGFSNVGIGVRLTRPTYARIRDCYFDGWRTAGVYAETTPPPPNIEGSPGWIENNWFFGEANAITPTTQGPCILTECGYINIARNLLSGGTVGVRVNVKNHPAGAPKIYQNWIEDQSEWGVWVTAELATLPLPADACTMLDVSENEFSNVEYTTNFNAHIAVTGNEEIDWISTIAIRNNIMRSRLSGNAKYIWLGTGRHATISGNLIAQIDGGSPPPPYGIQCTGFSFDTQLKPPITIFDNQFMGDFAAKLYLAPLLQNVFTVRDMGVSITVAQLPASAANGSEIYVSDGTPNSNPITGGSTGAIARRIGNVWRSDC